MRRPHKTKARAAARGWRASLLAAALLAVPLPSGADRIELANGRVVEGRVISRSEGKIRVEVRGTVMTLDAASVVSIVETAEWANTLLSAGTHLRAQRVVKGIDELFAAQRQGAPEEALVEAYRQSASSILELVKASRPSERVEIRRAIYAVLEAGFLDDAALFHTARILQAMEDWDGASAALARMNMEYLKGQAHMREWALEHLRMLVKRQLARGDFEAALGHVEQMRVLSGGGGDPQLPLAQLAAAASARDSHDYVLAFQIIADELAAHVPEIARNRAWYTLEQLKRRVALTGEYQMAGRAIEPLRRQFPVLYAEARAEFTVAQARRHLDAAEPSMALRLLAVIPEQERTAEMTALYRSAFHETQLAVLEGEDPLELLKHARWCLENNLHDEAIAILNKTRENPNLKQLSDGLLGNTYRERDTRLLEDAQQKYDVGDMPAAIALTQRILNNPDRGSVLLAQAEKLNDLAHKSMAREEEARPYQAEVFFQQAERAYFMGGHQEAFNLINLVLNKYADSPAAARAAKLLPDVVRQLELSYLEGKSTFLPSTPADLSIDKLQEQDALGEEVGSLLEAFQKAAP